MRSVVVVLPASMCAMIPMFRQRFRGVVRATIYLSSASIRSRCRSIKSKTKLFTRSLFLPAVVREGLVGLGHTVNIFLLLHRGATAVGCIEELSGQLLDHALFPASAAVGHEPADGERGAALGENFNRNLIVRSADAPAFNLEKRLAVLDCLLEELESFVAALLLKVGHGGIEDALSGRLLAAPHHGVHKLGDQGGVIDGVWSNFTLRDVAFSWHCFLFFLVFPQRGDFSRAVLGYDPKHRVKIYFAAAFISLLPSDASRRTWSGFACGWQRRPSRACREQRDSEHPADPLHGRRESAQSSAPADCGRCLECRS